MALRNIIRNKKNSGIVILLIGVITALFFIGNSVIASSNRGLAQSYIDSISGDIIIEKKGDVTMNLYGANAPIIGDSFSIPVLSAHDAILQAVRSMDGIESITSQVSGSAYLDVMGVRSYALLCGVDADEYFPQFPGIILSEGRFLQSGEYGAMITRARANTIENRSGQKLEIGAPLLFTSGGGAGFKIREVPLVGIYNYKNPGRFMDEIIILDPQTVRVLSAIQVASADVVVSKAATSLLDENANLDDIFGATDFFGDEDLGNAAYTGELELFLKEENQKEENKKQAAAASGAAFGVGAALGGDWNFILIRLSPQVRTDMMIARINKIVSNYDAMALGWRMAAGTSAILVLLLQALFNAGIFLVSVAGIIAIVNILLIAVFRRTREIGTLRAIGASDSYIRALILSENSCLAIAAGLVGILLGACALRLVNSLQIHIGNELLAGIFGGSVLSVDFVLPIAVLSVVLAFVLSAAASIFPIETAVKIDPIIAVRHG